MSNNQAPSITNETVTTDDSIVQRFMLSTDDNPFNPWTEWTDWYAFDVQRLYNSCALLARIANTSSDLPDEVNDYTIRNAIDEIVNENVSGHHIKVLKPD